MVNTDDAMLLILNASTSVAIIILHMSITILMVSIYKKRDRFRSLFLYQVLDTAYTHFATL